MNWEAPRFELWEYLNQRSCNQITWKSYWTRITETISFRSDRFEIRKIWVSIHSIHNHFPLAMNRNHHFFQQLKTHLDWSISNWEDLSPNHVIQILDIIVDKDSLNAKSPSSIEYKLGRSVHHIIHIIIPVILNEDQHKTFEAIFREYNLGRFFNSNPPP